MKKLSIFALALLATFAFTGCATKSSEEKADGDDEYIYVTSTNSRIPKKVKKGSAYNSDSGSSPMGTASGQQAQDYIGAAGATHSSAAN